MIGCCLRAAAAIVLWGCCFGSPLLGQSAATLGMSASIVEYDGFLSSGAATLTPAFRFDTPNLSLGAQGSWTVFESGNSIIQATGAAAWLTQLSERWRLELAGAAGVSRYAEQGGAAHVQARGRFHYSGVFTGTWVSATAGALDNAGEMPVELSVGAWSVRSRFAFVGTLTATWLGDDHHLDILGATRWTGNIWELEARMGARTWTQSGNDVGDAQTGMYGEVSALVPMGPRIALALSAGKYPSDPVRSVLAAQYFTAGLRLTLAGAVQARAPLVAVPLVLAARDSASSEDAGPARLEIALLGQQHVLRVHAADAATVELMGDFNDWKPVSLEKVRAAWEIRLPLSPGVHRLNVRINGGEWIVPSGARSEEGEFGGAVGVIVVR